MNSGRFAGVVLISITSLLWGTTGTAASFASQISPLAIGAAALGIGGAMQGLIAIPSLRREWAHLRQRIALVALGASAVAVYPLAFYSSMRLAGVAVGSVVSLASAPIVAAVLERLMDRRDLSVRWLVAVIVGVAGSAVLCIAQGLASPAGSASLLGGVFLGLVAGASYAVYSWVVHRLMAERVSRAASMGAVFGAGGLFLVPILLVLGGPILTSWSTLGVTAYIAFVPMFVGYVLFGLGLARIGASSATTVTLSEPAIATLLAVVIVGERLSVWGWVGLAAIALALVVLASPSRRSAAVLSYPTGN